MNVLSQLILDRSIICTIEVKKQMITQSLRQMQVHFVCALLQSVLPFVSMIKMTFDTSGKQHQMAENS